MKSGLVGLVAVLLCTIIIAMGSEVADAQITEKVWTVKEILAERKSPATSNGKATCNNAGADATTKIEKCVCPADVTSLVQYRPSIAQCGKKAGLVVSGRYIKMFSAVVRDTEDRDRWPANGVKGCSKAQVAAGLGKCSVFKIQKTIGVDDASGDAEVHCFGASGYSPLFKNVVRITIKPPKGSAASQSVHSEASKLERLCLYGPTLPLN